MFVIGGTQERVRNLMQLIELGLVLTLLLAVQHLGTWGSDIMHLQHAVTHELHSMRQIRRS
jgi:hypothetical protein